MPIVLWGRKAHASTTWSLLTIALASFVAAGAFAGQYRLLIDIVYGSIVHILIRDNIARERSFKMLAVMVPFTVS